MSGALSEQEYEALRRRFLNRFGDATPIQRAVSAAFIRGLMESGSPHEPLSVQLADLSRHADRDLDTYPAPANCPEPRCGCAPHVSTRTVSASSSASGTSSADRAAAGGH